MTVAHGDVLSTVLLYVLTEILINNSWRVLFVMRLFSHLLCHPTVVFHHILKRNATSTVDVKLVFGRLTASISPCSPGHLYTAVRTSIFFFKYVIKSAVSSCRFHSIYFRDLKNGVTILNDTCNIYPHS